MKIDMQHILFEKITRKSQFNTAEITAAVASSAATSHTREHWIQRITFAAETNAACSRGSANTPQ